MDQRVKEVTATCRIPAAEKTFRVLIKSYIQPERIQLASLRRSAGFMLQNAVPELTVVVNDGSNDIILERGKKKLRVNCPVDAPLWSFKMCARRLACAAIELVPDADPKRIDKILAQSLTAGLDPHTKLLWGHAKICHFTPEGCENADADVGIRVGRVDSGLIAMSVIPGSPAAKANIRAADRLIRIDGLPAGELEPEEAEWLLRGREGSQVLLAFERHGKSKLEMIWLLRKKLDKQKGFKGRKFGRIAYLRILEFVPDVASHLKTWVEAFKNPHGFILDLRDNPGGLMMEAIEIADFFIRQGAIMFIQTHDGKERFELPARSGGTAPLKPMVVLVNSRSASASELLAGTLQDHGRALIVGQRTYGKGSIQIPVGVPGGYLMMTVMRYLTGKGLDIQAAGITPDIRLRPVHVSRDGLRLRHWPVPTREADRKRTLKGGKVRQAKEPIADLEFLAVKQTGESDEAVAIAINLIKKMPWLGRLKGREAEIVRILGKFRSSEKKKIRSALAKLGVAIDPQPGSKLSFDVNHADCEVMPGEQASLKIGVRNTGPQAIHGLSCHIETSNPFFTDKEIAFASIAPGGSQEQTLNVHIPAGAYARQDPLKLVWHGPEGSQLDKKPSGPFYIRIKSMSQPRIGAYVYMDDRRPGGNGDGRISKGEPVKICARIRNFGAVACPEVFVSVDTRLGPISGWRQTYHRFKPLDPGQVKSVCFQGKTRQDFKEEEGTVTVRYGEWNGRILGTRSVEVASSSALGKAKSEKPDKKPVWSPALEVEAASLAVNSESLCLSVQAWSNGQSLRDMFIYVEGEKILYRSLEGSQVQLKECIKLQPGSSQIDIVVRNDNRSSVKEKLFVYRLK
ncbi:MAG: PDZ domain-containing protein [Deltaproteobacteria bacterium]|nr:PDZ domain-containing protein [Deltaproteobacteria bacterium]